MLIIHIATVKALFSSEKCCYLSYFSTKIYGVGTHKKRLTEALLMSTHNVCFHGEIRKILCEYPLLSVAMIQSANEPVDVSENCRRSGKLCRSNQIQHSGPSCSKRR